MKKILIFVFLVFFHSESYCMVIATGFPVDYTSNIEIGETSPGVGMVAGHSARSIDISTPVGGITVSHGYWYTNTDDGGTNGTFTIAIYNLSGVQQGGCSSTCNVVDGSSGDWNEVNFYPAIDLAGSTTYRVVVYPTEMMELYYHTGDGDAHYTSSIETCPLFVNTPTSLKPTITIANYQAHNGGEDTTPPVIIGTPEILTSGTSFTIDYSESVDSSGYSTNDYDIDCTIAGNNLGLSSPTGSGSSRTFTISTTIESDDVCNLDFNGAVGSIEDLAGNSQVSFENDTVYNGSGQGAEGYTETFYVTQDGAGSPWSVAQFNDPGNWDTDDAIDGQIGPNDVVFFSGEITSRLVIPASGSSAGYVTLDGYEAGDQNPVVNGSSTGSAKINYTGSNYGIELNYKDYIIFQDFEITGYGGFLIRGGTLAQGSSDAYWSQYIKLKRNWIHDTTNYPGLQQTVQTSGGYASTGVKYLTIGGDDGDGNFFDNCKKDTYESHVLGLNRYEDAVISYNKIVNDSSSSQGGQNNVAAHYGKRLLMEYNEIGKARGQAGISLKENGSTDVIIRFNNIYGCDGGDGRSISVSRDALNVYVYGNRLHGSMRGIVCMKDSTDVFIWSNVIAMNETKGVDIQIGTTGNWSTDNTHIYNNTIVDNRQDVSTGWHAGIHTSYLNGSNGLFFINNILKNNHGSTAYVELAYQDNNPVTTKDNIVYNSYGTPKWVWGSSFSGDQKTLSQMQALGQEAGTSLSDPLLNSNYTLQSGSPAIGTGTNISEPGNWDPPTIQGTDYSSAFDLSIGLDPDTDWTVRPTPTSITTLDRDVVGYDKGAYPYK